jgi:LruC domain-containing protein
MRRALLPLGLCAASVLIGAVAAPREAAAIGNAATHFTVFAPPNNSNNGRHSMLIVTAQSSGTNGRTQVDIVDDGADGDSDDSYSVSLARGQSQVIYLRDGAINDDAGGVWDGDLFDVRSDAPVTVLLATRSDWEHDWVPGDNNRMLSQSFFIFAPDGTGSKRDVDVFAYTANTRVRISEISESATLATGATQLSSTGGRVLLETTLGVGEDLMVRRGLGVDLMTPGHTYLIEASEPVTAITGALETLGTGSQARDGGGFVPSANGASTGDLFYFTVPHDPGRRNEQEIRVVGYDASTSVALDGWNATTLRWESVGTYALPQPFDHADIVGPNYDLFRLTATAGKRVSVFEANWLETGSIGTSDVASYVSAADGSASGRDFLAYIPPPGIQNAVRNIAGTYSHLYIFARSTSATVTISDADTGGTLFSQTVTAGRLTPADVRVDSAQWNSMNVPAMGRRPYLRVTSDNPIAVWSTNFNDNWLSYAASAAPANPTLQVETASPTARCGVAHEFVLTAENTESTDLTGASLDIDLGEAWSFVAATDDGAVAVPTSTINAAGTVLTLPARTLAAGSRRVVRATLRPECAIGGLRNGSRVAVRGIVRATGPGLLASEPLATAASELTILDDPSFTAFSSASAVPSASAIVVRASTAREARAVRFELVRASAPGGIESMILSSVTAGGSWSTGSMYQWTDTAVTVNATYYYRVRAVLDDGAYIYTETLSAKARDTLAPDVPAVFASGGDNRANLSFSGGDRDGDLSGYVLERSEEGGPFIRIVAGLVNASTYVDTGVLNGRRYAWRISAQDSSNNVSAASDPAYATPQAPTNASSTWTVAFEDRLGSGDNDWDYNDLIVETVIDERFSSGSVTGYVIDVEPLARGAWYDHALRLALPAVGPWTARVDRWASAAVVGSSSPSSTTVNGTDAIDLEVIADTRAALPPNAGESATNTVTGSATVAGAHFRVTITLADAEANPSASRPAAPFDFYLRVTRPTVGDIHSSLGAARPTEERVARAPGPVGVVMPMAIVIQGSLARWSAESVPTWTAFDDFEAAARSDYRMPASTFTRHASWLTRAR